MPGLVGYLDLMAVAVFAISGALAAAEEKLDILGFILFGTLTGVGGGTVRDLLLQSGPVFWIGDVNYLWACILASTATWFLAPALQSVHRLLIWADAAVLRTGCRQGAGCRHARDRCRGNGGHVRKLRFPAQRHADEPRSATPGS
jgi:uncharacterized membrane protein YeiH